jgi:hypothetical protein
MSKFSMKQGGKEVGYADVYAAPHNMKGQEIDGTEVMEQGEWQRRKSAREANIKDPLISGVSYGIGYEKTDGIEMRGAGAATKGKMSRGPMA